MTEKIQNIMAILCISLLIFSVFSVVGLGEGFTESHTDIRIIVQKRGVDLEELYGNSDYEVIEDYDSYLLVDTSEEGKESLENQDVSIELLHNRGHVGLQSYSFDTKEGTLEIPENMEIDSYSEKGTGYYIVQFIGPIRSEWQDELEEEGAELHEFRHRFNFIVEMDLETKGSVEQKDFVNWIGTYQPAYRFDRELLEDFDEKIIEVSFFDGVDLSESAGRIESLGGEIKAIGRNRVTAEIHTQRIERVANLKGVNSITEGTEEYELYNADATWITQTNKEDDRKVTYEGITGEGELITVMDSELYGGNSIYEDHEMWNDTDGNLVGDDHRKIQAHYVPGGASGDLDAGEYHGTHVTGTVLGNSPEYDSYEHYDGNALGARLVFQDIDDGTDDYIYPPSDMYEDGYGYPYTEWGAKTHTNSWGGGSGYGPDSIEADEFIWDHKDYNILYAMGNEGSESNTLSEQAEGKNVISVGSVINYPYQDEVSTFSSRGYADDGRIKPTVLHVGGGLGSADWGYDNYASMSGTSMATPGIAGQAGQIRQYYEEGWYPLGTPVEEEGFNPSNALVRATLINGAVEISGSGAYENDERFPNNDQGYGRSKLDRVLHFEDDERNLIVYDSWNENHELDTGEDWTMEFNVNDPNQELEVTLAWSDYPGSSGSDDGNPAIVNDLDLELNTPDGNRYVGNAFTGHDPGYSEINPTDNPWSGQRDGEFDGLNVEENILLLPDQNGVEEGTYEVTVDAHNVPEGSQPFAVVVSGGVSEHGPSVEVTNPEGGERWEYGDTETIEWDAQEDESPIDSIDLEYSIDGGSSYTEIDTVQDVEEGEGSYEWDIPDVTSDEVVIQATVHDEDGLIGSDISDLFTIEGSPPAPPEDLDVQHADLTEKWHWMYDAEHRAEPDSGIGVGSPGPWYGAIRKELPKGEITDIAYHDLEEAYSVQGYIYEDAGDQPGELLGETYEITDLGHNEWRELPLKTPVDIEADHYWIALEIDDIGDDYYPFGVMEPYQEDSGWISYDGEDWIPLEDEGLDYSWALEAKVREADQDDNLITWDASPEDPENVSHYTIYRSEDEDGPWDDNTRIDEVEADGSNQYNYIDREKGMADDTFWWYVVRAVDEWIEEENEAAVQEPIRPFKVEIHDYGEEAIKGEEYSIQYNITNIGEDEDTQDIIFAVDGEPIDDEEVNLEVDEQYQGEFTWTPEDLGGHTLKVSSEDHSDEVTISVVEDSNFEVRIRSYEREVIEGDEVVVEYEVKNTGGVEDTQRIEFIIEDEVIEYEEVTLGGGDTYESEFTWKTEESDAGRYEIEVSSEDDKDDRRITVLEADIFAVEIRLHEREIVEGQEVVVNYTIMNTKEEDATQDIEFTIYDRDDVFYEDVEKDLTIPSREEYEGNFTWQTEEGDSGRYIVEVASEDDKDDSRVTVFEDDVFAVDINIRDREVIEGEELTVNYTVWNTKEDQDTQTINFDVYELIGFAEEEIVYSDEKDVTLSEMEEYEDYFTWNTEEGDAGDYRIELTSEDDEDDTRITILETDIFSIDSRILDRDFDEGEEVVVEYTVLNTKDVEDTQDIELKIIDDEDTLVYEEVEKDLTIDSGETYEGEFIWQTEESDSGNYVVKVASEDDNETSHISVWKADSFSVIIDLPDRYRDEILREGQEISIYYSIKNTREDIDTQDIRFYVDDELIETKEEVKLEAGEKREREQFEWTTEEPYGERTLTVESNDDSDEAMIEIGEDPYFEVEINEPEDGQEFEEGEQIVVNYTVTNTGDVTGKQTVDFFANVEKIDEREIELGSEESESVELLWDADEGTGDYELSVRSRDDEETVTINVIGEIDGEDPYFEVEINEPEEGQEFEEGEQIVVNYTVTNTGNVTGKQTIISLPTMRESTKERFS